MNHRFTTHLTALAAATLVLFGAGQALGAGGTDAGVTVSNSATLSYKVGTVSPPDVTSTPATFVVDYKINPVVTSNGGGNVVPNGTGYALKFTVTNSSNTKAAETLQLKLAAVKNAGFDMNDVKIYLDDPANGTQGTFDAEDDDITADPFIPLGKDASAVIYIVATTPPNGGGSAPDNGETASYDLLATAWDGGGSTGAKLAADAGGDDKDAEEVVYADGDGPAEDDKDGAHSATGTYTVVTATLAIDKSSAVIGGSGYYIPGETVEYTITVSNGAGAATATDITVSDSLNAEIAAGKVAFTAGSIKVKAPNLYSHVETGLTDGALDDEGEFAANTVTVNGIALDAGQSATVKFRVTIQ